MPDLTANFINLIFGLMSAGLVAFSRSLYKEKEKYKKMAEDEHDKKVEVTIDKKLENVVVVSPDHGGAVRAREFAKVLGTTIAIIDKRRPEPNRAEVMNIVGLGNMERTPEISSHIGILMDLRNSVAV